MRIGITGATGFLGRYITRQLAACDHQLRLWYRPQSDRSDFESIAHMLEWIPGELGQAEAERELVQGCDTIVHAALWRPDKSTFQGREGDIVEFVERNIMGSLRLIAAARAAGVPRFIFISTCAVHDQILSDRPLDEKHPLWPKSHYGAHKAAIEKFVHSYGLGEGYDICALRPTGIYGVDHPIQQSKWYDLVRAVIAGQTVDCRGGGKEVHAADVAKSVERLLTVDGLAGQSYNCYDMYVSQYDIATIAQELSGSAATIRGQVTAPKHQIETGKLRALGVQFGGRALLETTIAQLVTAASP